MIDGGIVMILTGALLMLAHPLGRVVVYRRARTEEIGIVLRSAYPVLAVPTSYQVLVCQVEAALDADAEERRLVAVGRAHDRA